MYKLWLNTSELNEQSHETFHGKLLFFTIFNLIGLISDLVESLDEGIFSILI